jgi:predicted small secreted protein
MGNVCSSKSIKEEGFLKMKNKWLLGLCVLLVFGFILAGCDTGSGGGEENPFVGTWILANGDSAAIFYADMTFTISGEGSGVYTVSGKTATLTATSGDSIFMAMVNGLPLTIAADGSITTPVGKATKVS